MQRVGARAEVVAAKTVPLLVPATAEIVLEGWVHPGDTAPEGPFGDHTGYYNSVEPFPVMRLTAITHRRDPLYLTTVTGRPPDEPSVIGEVFNMLALPVIRAQIPEVTDLWLPAAPFKGLTAERLQSWRGPMYRLFEAEFAVHMVRAEEKLRAVAAGPEEAELLQVAPGTPLLSVERLSFTYGDRAVELRRGLYHTRHHHYRNELS